MHKKIMYYLNVNEGRTMQDIDTIIIIIIIIRLISRYRLENEFWEWMTW